MKCKVFQGYQPQIEKEVNEWLTKKPIIDDFRISESASRITIAILYEDTLVDPVEVILSNSDVAF